LLGSDFAQCRPVLRVDAESSGLTVLARDRAAHARLVHSFTSGSLAVTWAALVEGRITRAGFTIDKPLGADRGRPGFVRTYAGGAKRARPAQTEVRVVETFDRHTLIDAVPRTDRGHQLRAHLAAAHHPIVGDAGYGASAKLRVSDLKRRYKARVGVEERPIVQRLCAHARRLAWQHASGELVLESPLPKDFAGAVVRLRRFARR
jgi:23S rRNA pseudouridine955/2504/2580 synthase/23S rRNA pseudouridine1911/1915/1917 synthase